MFSIAKKGDLILLSLHMEFNFYIIMQLENVILLLNKRNHAQLQVMVTV